MGPKIELRCMNWPIRPRSTMGSSGDVTISSSCVFSCLFLHPGFLSRFLDLCQDEGCNGTFQRLSLFLYNNDILTGNGYGWVLGLGFILFFYFYLGKMHRSDSGFLGWEWGTRKLFPSIIISFSTFGNLERVISGFLS